MNKNEQTLLDENLIMPLLRKVAQENGWRTFLFKDEELRKVFPNANEDVGVALMSKNEDTALWNLKNLKRCYLVKLNKNTEHTTTENQESLVS